MNMEERNTINTLYKLAKENENSKNYVSGLVYEKIQRLKKDMFDLEELLKAYKDLEEELKYIKN